MKKTFAAIAFTLFLFSYMAIAQDASPSATQAPTSTPTAAPTATAEAGAEILVEATADAEIPDAAPAKLRLHTLFVASAQGIGVDSAGDSSNFVLVKGSVGRLVLTKKLADADAGDADNEARCNEKGRCLTVRKRGVLAVTSKEETTRYHLKNVVVGEGTVSAEVYKDKQSVGAVSLSLVQMAGGQEVWTGKLTISGKEWNVYLPFKAHRKLVRPAMVQKAMEIPKKCGLTKPLEARAIRECVQNGGKAMVKKVDGCPMIECAKPAMTVSDLSAKLKAKCDAKGGTLVRKPVRGGKVMAGLKIACVVEGRVVEESPSTEESATTPSPGAEATASPTATAIVQAPTATTTIAASATATT